MREDISIALQYIASYLQGAAAAAIESPQLGLHLMEDMATAEIRRAALWLRLRHGTTLTGGGSLDGQPVTGGVFRQLLDEETEKLQGVAVRTAREILWHITNAEKLIPWISDPLNIVLDEEDPGVIQTALHAFLAAYVTAGRRLTRPDLGLASHERAVFESEVAETDVWMNQPRFQDVHRRWTARAVVAVRQSHPELPIRANEMAGKFWDRLVRARRERRTLITFGAVLPADVAEMAEAGIEYVYDSGWVASLLKYATRRTGPDQAKYTYDTVPKDVDRLYRFMERQAEQQHYMRSQLSLEELARTPLIDFLLPVFADADTGHDAVNHLMDLFIDFRAAGVHLEDQRHGKKECGHQSGKVLVSIEEHENRLYEARHQADIRGSEIIIVARTDAEAAHLIESNIDERNHPFILGTTNPDPELGSLKTVVKEAQARGSTREELIRVTEMWLQEARLMTYLEAVAQAIQASSRSDRGDILSRWNERTRPRWHASEQILSHDDAVAFANELGFEIYWDWEKPRTVEGYYQFAGGTEAAIWAASWYAGIADGVWMEQAKPLLAQAKEFADGVRKAHPDTFLFINLSPSFDWDNPEVWGNRTSEEINRQLLEFLPELGKIGYEAAFITVGGAHAAILAAKMLSEGLTERGMLAYVEGVQRLEKEVRARFLKHQTYSTAPLSDARQWNWKRDPSTLSMGKGSTETQFGATTPSSEEAEQ